MPNENANNRDIVLHYRDGGLQHILELHRGYDPLQYPLIFPHGTDGWNINLKLANGKKLTALVYYRYHIMARQTISVQSWRKHFDFGQAKCNLKLATIIFQKLTCKACWILGGLGACPKI